MKQKFKITGYQVVHADNSRDTFSMVYPEFAEDLEEYREAIKRRFRGCKSINLNVVQLGKEEER